MKDIEFLKPPWQDLPAVTALVSTRAGGHSLPPYDGLNLARHVGDQDSSVDFNRQLLQSQLPGQPKLQWLNQVHGKEVLTLKTPVNTPEADGSVTKVPGLACCVMTADCLPVFMASDSGDEVSLVHAGWRGLAAGIIGEAIKAMDTPATALRAWLGPAIAQCHFEVGEEVLEAFLQNGPEAETRAAFQATEKPGKYMADIYALARLQLESLGLANISGGEFCSYCDAERFYSYRRDGRTGRNLSLIYIQPD